MINTFLDWLADVAEEPDSGGGLATQIDLLIAELNELESYMYEHNIADPWP